MKHNGVDAWHFALPDGLGSVRHVLDENLNTVYSADYAAYGDVIASEGANPMDYGYTGQPLDANGLAYHRARFYDPSLGVWNSQDPLELMNRYGYVDGNPINLRDTSGGYPDCNELIPYPEHGSYLHCSINSTSLSECEGCCSQILYGCISQGISPTQEQYAMYSECISNCQKQFPSTRIPIDNTNNVFAISESIANGFIGSEPPPIETACSGQNIAWGMYAEGFNVSGGIGIGAITGAEIVYDFGSMQRAAFEYSGNTVSISAGVGGSYYIAHGAGFPYNGGIENYEGIFYGLEGGYSFDDAFTGSLDPVTLGPGIVFGGFSSPLDSTHVISAAYFGLSLNLGASIPIIGNFTGYKTDYAQVSPTYSYVDNETNKVNPEKIYNDILFGIGLLSTISNYNTNFELLDYLDNPVAMDIRRNGAIKARGWAEFYNATQDCTCR